MKDCHQSERPASQRLTVGQMAAFSVVQEGDFQKCRAKNAALIAIIEAANEAQKPKRNWWEIKRP